MRIERPRRATGQADRITELWAWTVIDPATNVEGILAARMSTGAMPMVGSTKTIIEKFEPFAVVAAAEVGSTARLRRFVPADE